MIQGKGKKENGKKSTDVKLPRFVLIFYFCLFPLVFLLLPGISFAQDEEPAPPPLKILTKQEKSKLDSELDLRARTKAAVELMRSCIDTAEKLNAANDFDGVFRQFGHFRGLLEYSLAFLERQDVSDNKSLDNYKRLELSLRAVTPRIEAIRRELPVRYEEYVRGLLNFVRDARSKANESLFGDTVLPAKDKE